MGDYYTNPENTRDYDGHDVFNLRTNWNVNEDVRVALNILNVTDEDYAERADWTVFGGDRYFVGQPVRAFLSDKPALKAAVFLDEDGELSKRHHVNSAPWLLILKDGRTSFSEKLPRDPHAVVAQVLGS